jgi:hypothetical protein
VQMGSNFRMVSGEIEWEGVDWIHLDENRDHWRALVNTVMNLRDLKGRMISSLSQ